MSDFPEPGRRASAKSVEMSARYAEGGPGKWDTIKAQKSGDRETRGDHAVLVSPSGEAWDPVEDGRAPVRGPIDELGDQVLVEDREAADRLRAHVAGAPRRPVARSAVLLHDSEAERFVNGFKDMFKEQQEAAKAATFGDERPLRQHANARHDKPDRRFDTTALHAEVHSTLLAHGDYLAHVEKYDYVWRSILKGDRILDVGCGTDLPLLVAINRSQSQATKLLLKEGGCYTGVDMNKLKSTGISWATLLGETDLTSDDGFERALAAVPGNVDVLVADLVGDGEVGQPRGYTLIVALEVIEHMEVADGTRLLENMRDLKSPDGRIVLSTPIYDGKAMARNHIHEYYAGELAQLIESVGLTIEKRMGTFTAEPVIKPWLKENRPDWYALYMEAREFHSAAYMSGLMAPMFPDLSRNNVWVLR